MLYQNFCKLSYTFFPWGVVRITHSICRVLTRLDLGEVHLGLRIPRSTYTVLWYTLYMVDQTTPVSPVTHLHCPIAISLQWIPQKVQRPVLDGWTKSFPSQDSNKPPGSSQQSEPWLLNWTIYFTLRCLTEERAIGRNRLKLLKKMATGLFEAK